MEAISKLSDLSSADMERALISGLINAGCAGKSEPREKCKKRLSPEAFTESVNKTLYKLIIGNGKCLDLASLWREVENKGLTTIVDKAYLMQISDVATGYAFLDHYIDELFKEYELKGNYSQERSL